MHSLIVSQRGRFRNNVSLDALAAHLADSHCLTWFDIQDPTEEDVAVLREQFGFHPLAIEDATRAHERPKVDAYGIPGDLDTEGDIDDSGPPWAGLTQPAFASPDREAQGAETPEEAVLIPLDTAAATGAGPDDSLIENSYYFVIFYTAVFNPNEDHIEARSLSLFIGANYLVTVHNGPLRHVTETMARWRAPKSPLEHRVGALMHSLLDAMVDDYFPLMDQVADRVEDLEDAIFAHFDESSIETVFRLKKDLLTMRRVVAPERDVLNVLLRRQLPIISSEDVTYLQDVYDHIVRVTDNIDTYRDLLSSALDSYLSLQGNRLNQIMKTLTVASVLLMTAALITGFYGQNFHFFPELGFGLGSFWSLILIGVATLGLVIYFKRKRWW
jgi:magnesium transporter